MKYIYLLLFLICFNQLDAKFEMGVNLVDDGAFTNMINHTVRYSNATGYSEYGWPTSDFDLVLMDGRPAAEWTGNIDDPEQYRVDYSGTYKASFSGLADVTASGTNVTLENLRYDNETNTTYFDLIVGGHDEPNHGLVFLSFKDTRISPKAMNNSGISKLKVMRPGYELDTKKTFTDEYIALCKAADFACYRFYNVQNIWNGEPVYPAKTTWDNRKTPLDAAQENMQVINGKRDAWCWEYIVELSNTLDKDIWINIHMSCDSTYVAELAKFLQANLNSNINIYVENSNEVWSPTQATQGPYNKAEADNYGITFDQNYARRTVELSNWFANVFGKDAINNRIRVILAGQHAYNGRSDIQLNYINDKIGEPKNYIYATSTALYFQTEAPTSDDLETINNGMLISIGKQIIETQSSTYRLNHINKAKDWGLVGGCTSYEGGPHVPAGGDLDNLGNLINSHRTKEMGNVIKYNYQEGWEKIGGGLAMHFTLASSYNRYGCWGLTDDYTNPDRNYKMQAIRDIISTKSNITNLAVEDIIALSPNPTDGNIQLVLKKKLDELIVVDISGKTIFDLDPNIGSTQIDMSGFPSGVYFLKYSNGGVWGSTKIQLNR